MNETTAGPIAPDHLLSRLLELLSGDAYRYTIQPVFQNVKQQYQCQLRLRPQKVLYRLFYFLKLPGTTFQTPPVTMSVFASETNLSFQSHGTFKADYITVEHNTGFNLHKEFIIVGQEARGGGIANYTVNALKKDSDFKQKPVVVHEISHNILIASTQFRRPFDYSTMSWVRDNDCDKDVSRFAHVQKHYRSDSAQLVEVDLQKTPGSFKYFLKSVESPPYLHFTAPGTVYSMFLFNFYCSSSVSHEIWTGGVTPNISHITVPSDIL